MESLHSGIPRSLPEKMDCQAWLKTIAAFIEMIVFLQSDTADGCSKSVSGKVFSRRYLSKKSKAKSLCMFSANNNNKVWQRKTKLFMQNAVV